MSPAFKNQLFSNLASSAEVGITGYLTGGRAGAATALLRQEQTNLPKLIKTLSGKEPRNVQP